MSAYSWWLGISRRSEMTVGNPKPVYRFSHPNLSETTILSVNWPENISQHQLDWCIIYHIDIVIFSTTLMEHLKCLRAVFERLKMQGLG